MSGVSLGADPKVDAPQVKTQYRMRDDALTEDEMAKDKAAHEQIVRRLTEELNRA